MLRHVSFVRSVLPPIVLAGATLALFACAGATGGEGLQANAPRDVNAGLNALAAEDRPKTEEMQKFLERSAVDLEELKRTQIERQRRLNESGLNNAPLAQATLPETPPAPPEPEPASGTTAPDSAAEALRRAALEPAPPAPEAPSTQDRVRSLASELRSALEKKSGEPDAAIPGYLAMAVLEMLSAQEAGSPAPAGLEQLSERERTAVNSIRDLLQSLAQDPAAAADPERTASLLSRSLDALAAAQTVRIARAELCRRVEAFGRYTPFATNAFLAGQSNRVIVYSEIENYAHRDLGGSGNADRWSVELSQELQLFHADGSMLAWRQPEQNVTERSRNRRRDFFITQMIDLPRTLTVGPYSLKVIVRDRVSGARAEAVLPIRIVADASLIAGAEPSR